MKFSLLNTLSTREISLTKYREVGKLAVLKALGQVMSYRHVIKSYTAWILPTTNVKAKAMARTPQSEPLDCCPTSIILTSSSDAGLNTSGN